MDRTREPPRASEGAEPSAPRGDAPDLKRFRALVLQAQQASAEERVHAAEALNDALIRMRKPGNDEAEATEILMQLSLETLTTLTDERGRNCRKEAVETLMAMGFPHALKISPEDFEFARRYVTYPSPGLDEAEASPTAWQTTMRKTRLACAVLVVFGNVAGAIGAAGASGSRPGLAGFALVAALFNIGSALWLNSRRLHPDEQVLPLTGLVCGAALNLVAAVLASSFFPALGFVGTAAGIAAATSWQNTEKERDYRF